MAAILTSSDVLPRDEGTNAALNQGQGQGRSVIKRGCGRVLLAVGLSEMTRSRHRPLRG